MTAIRMNTFKNKKKQTITFLHLPILPNTRKQNGLRQITRKFVSFVLNQDYNSLVYTLVTRFYFTTLNISITQGLIRLHLYILTLFRYTTKLRAIINCYIYNFNITRVYCSNSFKKLT